MVPDFAIVARVRPDRTVSSFVLEMDFAAQTTWQYVIKSHPEPVPPRNRKERRAQMSRRVTGRKATWSRK